MHANHLCQMPQVKKGDASSLRQLIMFLVTWMHYKHYPWLCLTRFNVKSFNVSKTRCLKRNENGS
jgi:hypothetical protein